eukprot:CAMPEP_0204563860 /NCGR_PEP_ID=MMETSP0661-20131031/34553_1 /ASSEMBLY_ACC=CAM_ASM_000606 /TAXON_ID=109239 /ORGANISM="Alexandrium margalefi, Strain AMGDE01CS-322" /LENGTH=275 /DNA_ID=CAMNT_0051571451 /DNA_START=72 /DNA_END=897 /DNA_ORIENTATION=-
MAAMRTLLLCLAVAPVVLEAKKAKAEKAEKAEKAKPIITTDLVYGTFELVYDIYDEARGYLTDKAAPVFAPLMESASAHLPKDPVAELSSRAGIEKKVITENLAKAQGALLHAKSLAADASARAYEPLSALAVRAVTSFERAMPKYAGLIPKTLGDLALFLLYFLAVVYTLLRAAAWVLRTVSGPSAGSSAACAAAAAAAAAAPEEGRAGFGQGLEGRREGQGGGGDSSEREACGQEGQGEALSGGWLRPLLGMCARADGCTASSRRAAVGMHSA